MNRKAREMKEDITLLKSGISWKGGRQQVPVDGEGLPEGQHWCAYFWYLIASCQVNYLNDEVVKMNGS